MKLLVLIVAVLLPATAMAGEFVYEVGFAIGYEQVIERDHVITPKLCLDFGANTSSEPELELMIGPAIMYSRDYFELGPVFQVDLANDFAYQFLLALELKLGE